MSKFIKASFLLFQLVLVLLLFEFLNVYNSIYQFIDYSNYPLYIFFELPFIPPVKNLSFLFFFNVFVFFLFLFIISRKFNKKITLIIFIPLFLFFSQDSIDFFINNYFKDDPFFIKKILYVKTLKKFNDIELTNTKYSESFLQKFNETPYYKLINSEIKNPTLNKSVIKELYTFNNFIKKSNENYFLDKEQFNKFKDDNSLDTSPEFYIIYQQVYEDKVLTQIEKEQFLKNFKK